MPDDSKVYIRCAECGERLDNMHLFSNEDGTYDFYVGRCEQCLEQASEKGYQEGYRDAKYEVGMD